ncbi:MAG: TolC family protein [Chitinophagales bacterium]|nr:TolC family protein [Chitinophagales bacterium]
MKIFNKNYIIILSVLALQSCFVAKEYQQPQNVVGKNYFNTDTLSADSLTMADISWQEMFTDSLLQGYIKRALANNIDIRVALKQIDIANAYVKQGKLNNVPTFSADLTYGRTRISQNSLQGRFGTTTMNTWSIGGNLAWEADIWGKLRSERRAINASYLQTVAAHQAVTTGLISGIATAYFQLLAIDEQIKVTQSTLDTRKTGFETTKAIMEAGLGTVTNADVQQAEAQYISTKAILIGLEEQSHLLSNVISILMGDEPHDIQRTTLGNQSLSSELNVGVPLQLLNNRPDVRAAESAYRQAFELTNVAKANMYPALTISGRGGFDAQKITDWFDPKSWASNIAAGIMAPIFNQRALKTQYEVSKLQQDQALLGLEGALLNATKEVSDALYGIEYTEKSIEVKTEANNLLNQAVEDVTELFKRGYGSTSYIQVLIAQDNALNSSFDLINTKVSKLFSTVSLYQALGGGWK